MIRSSCRESNRKWGMTLLELLLATALVSVAALVVAQAFAAGFRVWHRASQLGGNYADAVIALESLQLEVRNTIPCRLTAFRGGTTWLEIPSLVTGSGTPAIGDQPGVIRYEFQGAGGTLDRIVTPCVDTGVAGESRREALAAGVEGMALLYADRADGAQATLSWVPMWVGRTNNPAAVKVVLSGKQGAERFELERTISLPVH